MQHQGSSYQEINTATKKMKVQPLSPCPAIHELTIHAISRGITLSTSLTRYWPRTG
jgi:hypothetical protein